MFHFSDFQQSSWKDTTWDQLLPVISGLRAACSTSGLAPLSCFWESSGGCPRCLGRCFYVGDWEEASGSWLQLGLSPGFCGYLESKPADRVFLCFSLSLCTSFKQISKFLKRKCTTPWDKNTRSLWVCDALGMLTACVTNPLFGCMWRTCKYY